MSLPAIAKSVEKLNYRVTVGDVAAHSGLDLNLAQQGLVSLAADAGGHLQVADTGEIVYLFPQHFQTILRNKYWRLRLKAGWEKVWRVLFYLIRISFGIILILSIVVMVVAIAAIIIALNSSRDDNRSGGYDRGSGGGLFFPRFWIGPDLFWFFSPTYTPHQRQRQRRTNEMNILEAIFSFLFGDGNPNFDLEERRWREIGAVIRNHGGAVVAQQMAPYLDGANSHDDEDFMLPVLTRFNGYPEVSPQGDIIYYFPDLQVTAQRRRQPVSDYLREQPWRFSQAGNGQILLAIGLGSANLILALVLGSLLQGGAVQLGGVVALVASIYWLLLGYGIAFLSIPLIRYFWIQGQNRRIEERNRQRQARASVLQEASASLRQKLAYARQFASEKVIGDRDITYSTETDLLEQEHQRSDQIDEEWRRRLESS